MKNKPLFCGAALLLALLVTACGGGAGGAAGLAANSGSGGGIGGTGLTSSGTIDGFGSVFVNGVEYETTEAEILVDGQRVGEDALGIGMVVLVVGQVSENGRTGVASRIVFDEAVRGPVLALTRDRDGDSMLVSVAGADVIVERTGTVFEGVRFDSLKVGDLVEVSGFLNAQDVVRATRIEKKEDFIAGVSIVELEGTVRDLNGTQFSLAAYTVDYSGAQLSDIPPGGLASGLMVEVVGTLDLDSSLISASRVELRQSVEQALGERAESSVQGLVTGFVSTSNFQVNGVRVDASAAAVRPADLVLANGLAVEVEGRFEGGVLRARQLEGRRGRVEIEAAVAAVDNAARTVSLQFEDGVVTVQLDSRTLLEDETDRVDRFTLADIRSGDFVEVEAFRLGDSLIATRIDREEADDNVLQAPIQAFVSGDSITLLGITFSTAGAEFATEDDDLLSASQFYGALASGTLVKVRDERPADGIAERVEFEFEGALDGEREFERDDSGSADDVHDGHEQEDIDEPEEPDETDGPDELDDPDVGDDVEEVDEPEEVDAPDQPDEEDELQAP